MYVRDGLLRSLSLRWSLSLRRSLSLVVGLFLSSYGVRGSLSLSVCFCTGHPSTNRSFPPQKKRKGKKKPTETCRAELSTFLSTCVENYFSTFTAYILCLSDCLTAPLPSLHTRPHAEVLATRKTLILLSNRAWFFSELLFQSVAAKKK